MNALKPIIREAKPEDRPFIEEIARLTWEGRDYLAKVFDKWLGDNFYVLELEGKVIGTVKLTLMPGKIGWLEGFRVHPDYRGKGYGRLLHMFMIDLGKALAERGILRALEFATYFLNKISIGLAEKTGFRIRTKFFDLSVRTERFEAKRPEEADLSFEDLTLDIIPIGWHFVERCEEALNWIKERAEVYIIGNVKFLASKEGASFTPLSLSLTSIKLMLPAMAWIAKRRGRESFSVMLPEGIKPILPELKALGLHSWEDKDVPNVIVFRKDYLLGKGS